MSLWGGMKGRYACPVKVSGQRGLAGGIRVQVEADHAVFQTKKALQFSSLWRRIGLGLSPRRWTRLAATSAGCAGVRFALMTREAGRERLAGTVANWRCRRASAQYARSGSNDDTANASLPRFSRRDARNRKPVEVAMAIGIGRHGRFFAGHNVVSRRNGIYQGCRQCHLGFFYQARDCSWHGISHEILLFP